MCEIAVPRRMTREQHAAIHAQVHCNHRLRLFIKPPEPNDTILHDTVYPEPYLQVIDIIADLPGMWRCMAHIRRTLGPKGLRNDNGHLS